MTRLLFFAPLLLACTPMPDAIPPAPAVDFDAVRCSVARSELASAQQLLVNLSRTQELGAAADATGFILFGLPAGRVMNLDKSGLIAAVKGKVGAIETRLIECNQ